MKSLESYYERNRPLSDVMDTLTDPALSLEQHRDDVDLLVLNLVVKFLAAYLKVPDDDVVQIRETALASIQKKPEDALNMILQFTIDAMGKGMDVGLGDFFALECLADIRSSAALVREIVFSNGFSARENQFLGVDYGSGTGILTLACVMAARRKKIRDILVSGFEKEPAAVQNSSRVLSALVSGQALIHPADVTDPALHTVFHGLPLHYWISETVSRTTPKIVCDPETDELKMYPPDNDRSIMPDAHYDVFPAVLGITHELRPSFMRDVRRRVTAMFPDVVNGLFIPDGRNTTLALQTGRNPAHVPLHEIGQEFAGYEDFGRDTRWTKMDPMDQELDPKVLEALRMLALEIGKL